MHPSILEWLAQVGEPMKISVTQSENMLIVTVMDRYQHETLLTTVNKLNDTDITSVWLSLRGKFQHELTRQWRVKVGAGEFIL